MRRRRRGGAPAHHAAAVRELAVEIGVDPVPPALAVGLAASCAFMLPIATGPNAIAYGTGMVRQSSMMKTGLVLNLACAAVIAAWVLLLA